MFGDVLNQIVAMFCCYRSDKRVRHYIVDQTSKGYYFIVGESKGFRTLSDLIFYYQQVSIILSIQMIIRSWLL